jgi:hypothetical protein
MGTGSPHFPLPSHGARGDGQVEIRGGATFDAVLTLNPLSRIDTQWAFLIDSWRV